MQNELSAKLNHLPTLLENRKNHRQHFIQAENFSYATLCSYDVLSFEKKHIKSVQCLVLAASLLLSNVSYPLTFLVGNNVKIDHNYHQLISKMKINIYRYNDIPIPQAAVAEHLKFNEFSWIVAYQKVHSFSLPYSRVLFLDNDMVVIKNIDHLFRIPEDMMGSDCTPHHGYKNRTRHSEGTQIGSIELITPSNQTFQLLYDSIQNGTVYDNYHQPIGWKYPVTDQSLYPAVLKVGKLPCEYQIFPDVCLHAAQPLRYFPLKNYYILHYTWIWHKGNDFLHHDSFDYYLRHFNLSFPLLEMNHRLECWRQFAAPFEHIYKALVIMNNNLTVSLNQALKSTNAFPTTNYTSNRIINS